MEIALNLWKPVVEIIILSYAVYVLLLFIKGTRTEQVLKGVALLAITFFITQKLGLDVINWILRNIFGIFVIAFLIIFQPELRKGLARLGQSPFISSFAREEKVIYEVVKAATSLARKKIGALIAFERETGLKAYVESGVAMDGKLSSELIATIFMPNTPLHDGGVIIREDRIIAAGCLFPLTDNPKVSKTLGTRHRAAIGLTEETDAIVLVVSEETGIISIALGGNIIRNLDDKKITKILKYLYAPQRKKISRDKMLEELYEEMAPE
ncbi:MAG: diadenylate cyclase CdaA [Candidatus Omnitrophota bacterium]